MAGDGSHEAPAAPGTARRLGRLGLVLLPYVVAFGITSWAGEKFLESRLGQDVMLAAGQSLCRFAVSRPAAAEFHCAVVDTSELAPPTSTAETRAGRSDLVTRADMLIPLIDAVAACKPAVIAIDIDLGAHQLRDAQRGEIVVEWIAEHAAIVGHCMDVNATVPVVLGVGSAISLGVPRTEWFHDSAAAPLGASILLLSDSASRQVAYLGDAGNKAPTLGIHAAAKSGRVEADEGGLRRTLLHEDVHAEREGGGVEIWTMPVDTTPLATRESWTVRPVRGPNGPVLPRERLEGRIVFLGNANVETADDVLYGGTEPVTGVFLHACMAHTFASARIREMGGGHGAVFIDVGLFLFSLIPLVALWLMHELARPSKMLRSLADVTTLGLWRLCAGRHAHEQYEFCKTALQCLIVALLIGGSILIAVFGRTLWTDLWIVSASIVVGYWIDAIAHVVLRIVKRGA